MNRQAVLLASLAAIIPAAIATMPAAATAGSAAAPFAPPSNGVLTRTVWRYLSDGQQIVVTRRYAVRFQVANEGYWLEGNLIEAKVDAPAELAAFAELERQRPDNTFPIQLDRSGRIVSEGAPPSPETRQRVDQLMRQTLNAARIGAAGKAEALGQVPLLSAAGRAGTPVWADLFKAEPGESHEVRKLALPGGAEGEVEVATRVGQGGVASPSREVERVVTTRLAGTTKVSREVWSLTGS
ncbi:MAG: hypothetical protein ACKOQ3_03025 [Novosphingobium sp.]